MAIQLTYYGNPILRKKCAPIEELTDDVRAFIREMVEWVREKDGLGLAGPQAGRALRVFVTCSPKPSDDGRHVAGDQIKVYINPKLTDPSPETWVQREACFSIPGVYPDIERPIRITVEALDLEGNMFTETLEGLPARIVMHENDHINGVLMMDRAPSKQRQAYDAMLRQIKKKYN